MYDYLIIGNGIAGLSAAEEIRKNDEQATIGIVSEERAHTYWRTRLSDLICKDFDKDSILVKSDKWYEDKNIQERLGVRIEKIEKDKAILEDGEEIEFKKLLIATGSHAFIPPIKNINSKGVFAIRDANDLVDFKTYVADKKKLAVIGGGILGLEAAYSAAQLGLEILVIESFDYLLGRQLDKDLSKKLEKSLNDMGIKTLTGKNTEEVITEDGHVTGLILSDGSKIEADAIMVQAGVRSNTEIAEKSGIKTDRGILVDESLRTLDFENIFAAGDVAQINDFTIGLWTASMEMGKIAGANMAGADKTYERPKAFSSLLIGDIKIFSAGMNSGEGVEELKEEKDGKIYKLFKKDGNFVGGILAGDIKYQMDVKKIVFDGVDPAETKLGKEIFGL